MVFLSIFLLSRYEFWGELQQIQEKNAKSHWWPKYSSIYTQPEPFDSPYIDKKDFNWGHQTIIRSKYLKSSFAVMFVTYSASLDVLMNSMARYLEDYPISKDVVWVNINDGFSAKDALETYHNATMLPFGSVLSTFVLDFDDNFCISSGYYDFHLFYKGIYGLGSSPNQDIFAMVTTHATRLHIPAKTTNFFFQSLFDIAKNEHVPLIEISPNTVYLSLRNNSTCSSYVRVDVQRATDRIAPFFELLLQSYSNLDEFLHQSESKVVPFNDYSYIGWKMMVFAITPTLFSFFVNLYSTKYSKYFNCMYVPMFVLAPLLKPNETASWVLYLIGLVLFSLLRASIQWFLWYTLLAIITFTLLTTNWMYCIFFIGTMPSFPYFPILLYYLITQDYSLTDLHPILQLMFCLLPLGMCLEYSLFKRFLRRAKKNN
ncbi:hypothetical protein PCE1_002446 [Barthelona sp. PCE]